VSAQDLVFIRGLRADGLIGIHPWERRIPQTLVFDLEMAVDTGPAAASDRIEDALDYDAVAKRLREFVAAGGFQLLEALAAALAAALMAEFGIGWLRLRVAKPGAVADAQDVGVVIERGCRAEA